MAPTCEALVSELRAVLTQLADAERARGMRRYMKDIAPYLGIPTPARRTAVRPWIAARSSLSSHDLITLAGELHAQPEREFAYTAIDLLGRQQRRLDPDALAPLRALALTVPWWDTVDAYATLLGRVGLRFPQWDPVIASWATDQQLWARRLALVFQVGRKESANLELLWAVCVANLGQRDFFMRKGIGWALRDAARSYPAEVRAFVIEHRADLSALSIREATKHLTMDDVRP